MTSAAGANDPELQRVLDAITTRYNSDKSFKEQISHTVKTHSENFVTRIIQDVLGYITGTLVEMVMSFVARVFR